MKLHIVAPDIRAGDAVGNHCLHLAGVLSQHGMEVILYARRHTADGERPVRGIEELLEGSPLASDDVLLLSYSTFQPRLAALLDLPCRKMVYFHGVTPVEHLLDHDPEAAYWSSRALLQLPLLARCEHIVSNSHWNQADLLTHLPARMPDHQLSVLPPITSDMPLFRKTPRGPYERHDPLRLLTVGRLAPHKRVDDVIRMTSLLDQHGVSANLTVIGSATSPDYADHLAGLAKDLGISTSVAFRGHVSDEALSQSFADADLLVSASLHEGFCIPVMEAMYLGLPVALRRGTAASEVAHGVGLEYDTTDEGAMRIARLVEDVAAMDQMARNGRARARQLLQDFDVHHLIHILRND